MKKQSTFSYYFFVFILIICAAALGTRAREQAGMADDTFLRDGWWDSGSCNGDDQWMCSIPNEDDDEHTLTGGLYGEPGVGCRKEAPECASGWASAVAYQKGDGACVLHWWRWECQGEDFSRGIFEPNKGQLWGGAEPERITRWREDIKRKDEEKRAAMHEARQAIRAGGTPCRLPEDFDASDARIILLSAYSGGQKSSFAAWSDTPPTLITVKKAPDATKAQEKFILVLSAYEPVEWSLIDMEENLLAVMVTGYEEQVVTGINESQPLLRSFYSDTEEPTGDSNKGECTEFPYFVAASEDVGGIKKAHEVVRDIFKKEIDASVVAEDSPVSMTIPAHGSENQAPPSMQE